MEKKLGIVTHTDQRQYWWIELKEVIKMLEDLKEIAKENDWEVATDDNCKDGFRVISGEEYLNNLKEYLIR